jgi:ZIP family zinc transporter
MLEIIAIAFLSGLTTFIGVLLAMRLKERKNAVATAIGFSAGIMVAVSFMELLPVAFSLTNVLSVILAFAVGFGMILAFDILLPHTHFIQEKGKMARLLKASYLVAFGLLIHDFPEGFAIAATYSWNALSGILVAVAIALHNIPEEFALSVPLVMLNKRGTLLKLASLSALAEPLGAMTGVALFIFIPLLNPLLMAFAAGAMVFVALDELLPLAKMYGKKNYSLMGVLLGILIYAALAMLLP